MSLIGISAIHAGWRRPADLVRLAYGAERALTVEPVSRHISLQGLFTQPVGQREALGYCHGQLALLALVPEIGHQLAGTHIPSVTRQAPRSGAIYVAQCVSVGKSVGRRRAAERRHSSERSRIDVAAPRLT